MTDNIKNTKIVQRNLRGALASKSAIIKQYFDKNAVDWAAFMETFADETMQDTILGYKGYHRQRDHGSQKRGGVAIYIKDDGTWKHMLYHKSPVGSKIESITVKVMSANGVSDIYFTCAYMVPDITITEEDLLVALP